MAPITDPVALRLVARAGELLAALTHPDVAALIGALPRRPGESMTLAEAGAASGLDGRRLGRAVSRGRTAGVLVSPSAGRIGVSFAHVDDVVEGLTGLSPLATELDQPGPAARLGYGRLTADTADPIVLRAVAGVVRRHAPTPVLTERELGAILELVGDDVAALRRALVDTGHLDRDPGGSCYRIPRAAADGVADGPPTG